ncbi:MAG: hypothetical protein IJE46_06740 [Clostridia bacterium]|nr:hypothetical protein [Clostridia bacterium]
MARYIDADKLYADLKQKGMWTKERDLTEATIIINKQPTADVEKVKHGEWKSSVMSTGAPHCSLCNAVAPSRYTYCPHCGAKMRGDKE